MQRVREAISRRTDGTHQMDAGRKRSAPLCRVQAAVANLRTCAAEARKEADMCMIVDEAVTKKVQARLKRGGGVARFWKVFRVEPWDKRTLRAVAFPNRKNGKINRPGRYRSSRQKKSYRATTIYSGYHVFYTEEAANSWADTGWFRETMKTVPVWCRKADFVVGGHWKDHQAFQAVFTHIKIKPKDFAKATGGKA
ncbi:hypothetical protein LCGC14_0297720 [marine sediment metagenome]|uniref:Uncharacterized protein n=1 Tax=marine sediment metagenome TaxID=412755 RepID=A0A0F9WX06_9ZZZZ